MHGNWDSDGTDSGILEGSDLRTMSSPYEVDSQPYHRDRPVLDRRILPAFPTHVLGFRRLLNQIQSPTHRNRRKKGVRRTKLSGCGGINRFGIENESFLTLKLLMERRIVRWSPSVFRSACSHSKMSRCSILLAEECR